MNKRIFAFYSTVPFRGKNPHGCLTCCSTGGVIQRKIKSPFLSITDNVHASEHLSSAIFYIMNAVHNAGVSVPC